MYVGERCSIVTCAACLGERRDERHRRRAAADHDDALAGVVEVGRPLLRVHDACRGTARGREVRRVAGVVVVVARAARRGSCTSSCAARPSTRRARRPSSARRRVDQRARSTWWPNRICRSMPYALGGLADVREDRRAVGDRLVARPRPEREAERVHVRVGADARIAEQVPRAADALARLEDRVASAAGSASAGDTPRRCRRCRRRPRGRRRAPPRAQDSRR